MKKIICIFLTALLVLASNTFVFASSNDNVPDRNVSDIFKEVCDEYYSMPSNFIVLNKDGANISKIYFDNTSNYFAVDDYEAIWEYVWNNVSQINKITPASLNLISECTNTASRASKTIYVSDWKYVLIPISSDVGSLHFTTNAEGKFTVNGRIDYNPNTGNISYARTSGVTLDASAGTAWSIQAVNSQANPAIISSDGFSATFSGSCYVAASIYYNGIAGSTNTSPSQVYHSFTASGE